MEAITRTYRHLQNKALIWKAFKIKMILINLKKTILICNSSKILKSIIIKKALIPITLQTLQSLALLSYLNQIKKIKTSEKAGLKIDLTCLKMGYQYL